LSGKAAEVAAAWRSLFLTGSKPCPLSVIRAQQEPHCLLAIPVTLMLGLGYKGSVTPYYLVGYRGVSEENSALIIYLFFILYYDQQMHNYLTKYHTPNSEVEQK